MENLTTPSRKPPVFRRPAIVLDRAEKNSDSSSSDAPDGVHFRKPLAPVQMTISPGNAANDAKLAEKLKRLELSRKKTTRSHPIDLKTPSKVDLVATERLFVESSVENIAQTPRNEGFREPFRTQARFTPHNASLMDFPSVPRDSMRSNATYVLSTPLMDRALHPHHDPFTPSLATPSRKTTTVSTPLAYEEKLERQFVALSSWANVILDSASFVSEIDLGTSKQDASRKLQEMLTRPHKRTGGMAEGLKGGRYTDMCLRKKCLDYLKRADSVYQSIAIPGLLKAMVERGEISIKQNIEVYANIGVQTSLLSLLFSLHPFWLFIAVETVCAEFNDHDTVSLDARLPFSSVSFAPATVRFVHEHILANAKLMAKKKFAIGTVKKIVTEKGREMLHKHCITCILSMAVLLEYAKNSYLFENTPGLFVKNSEIKTVTDFCTELSRLVLSASGTPLNKAFDKSSFRRTYRQSFLEEYQYVMKSVRDMADGIILGRLIELLTDSQPLSVIGSMRNPQGDRIRKKGNVEKALAAAEEAGIDIDGISIDHILAAHRESCLDLMWRLVGVYVKKKAEREPLRRESLCLDGATDMEDGDGTVMGVVGAPLGGMAESAFTVYQQLAFQYGLTLSKWADLEDGVLLSSIWQYYNCTAPDVRFYEGNSLFDKVAHAAESDLGIPLALTALRDERQLGLFAHMFLSRLISYKRLRDSEMSDGESDASSIVSIIRKEGVNLSEETERIHRVRLESAHTITPREEEERMKMEEEKRREEELRIRFEEEEEERLTSEWRSPSRGTLSVEIEEKMLLDGGEDERIEQEMRKAQEERLREEEARLELERVKREQEEKLAEEQRMREEEEVRRKEEEERERRDRVKSEEAARAEEERERLRVIEEARVKAEEEERLRREEEERMRLIEEARILAEEEERERLRVVKEEEERREKEGAAVTIQCWIRGVYAVRLLNGLREERNERLWREEQRRNKAALNIQCWIRRVYAVRLLNGLREERNERLWREEQRRNKAALNIQCWIRRVYAVRLLNGLREERNERLWREEQRRNKAALNIQCWIRRVYAVRLLNGLREERNERLWREEQRRNKAALNIQCWIRRVYAVRLLNGLREERNERLWREEQRRNKAALNIQCWIRRVYAVRLLNGLREERNERLWREEQRRNKAALNIQCWIRRVYAVRLLNGLREERNERLWREEQRRNKAALNIQCWIRRVYAVRLLNGLREERNERLWREEQRRNKAALNIQCWIRRVYAVRLLNGLREERNERLWREEQRRNKAALNIQCWIRRVYAVRLLNGLREERNERLWREEQRRNKAALNIQTIGGYSTDELAAGVREIRRRQRKVSLTLSRLSTYNNVQGVQAAIKIQAWWRGIMTRRRHRVQIELIAVRMKEFNQQADKAMEGDSRERSIPVSKRLEKAKNSLQNPIRLYDIKVACYTTMSLCRLSSLYCERAIVLGLPALIIDTFTVQADRSPAFEEIIEFGVQALEEMVKCPTVRVRESMVAQGTDVVRIAAHQMLAFHLNKTIASTAIKILRQCKEILPVETHDNTFSKMHSYYFKKGEEKFGKLPLDDVRHKEFVELKKAFSK